MMILRNIPVKGLHATKAQQSAIARMTFKAISQ